MCLATNDVVVAAVVLLLLVLPYCCCYCVLMFGLGPEAGEPSQMGFTSEQLFYNCHFITVSVQVSHLGNVQNGILSDSPNAQRPWHIRQAQN